MARIKAAKKGSKVKAEQLKPVAKAVSVDKMVEENIKAVHTTDYQTYLRKLMREAAGKF